MPQAAITQLVFDITTAILLLLWYFPVRWLCSANVEAVKINGFIQAALGFERMVKVFLFALLAIIPTVAFFLFQHKILPTFIVAGHFGIWLATAPMFVVTCYFQFQFMGFWIVRMKQEAQTDEDLLLTDLRTRYAKSAELEQENERLRNSQRALATEADVQINRLTRQVTIAQQERLRLLEQLQQAQTSNNSRQQQTTDDRHQPPKQADTLRPDAPYYVCIRQMVLHGKLLRAGKPVNMAHARRYLTKENCAWIKQAKGGGPLYAKVEHLLRKGYETAAIPLEKTLLFRRNSANETFEPLILQMPENEAVKHLSELQKRYPIPQ